MSEKIKEVRPRFAPHEEQTVSTMEMGELMSVSRQDLGFRSRVNAIEGSYGLPAFDEATGEKVSAQTGIPVTESEEEKMQKLYKRYDCTHGCKGRQTVQPLGSDGRVWQCSACGKQYEMQRS